MTNAEYIQNKRDSVPSVLAKIAIDIAHYRTKNYYPYTEWEKQADSAYTEILLAYNDDDKLCKLSKNANQYFFKMPQWGYSGT